MFHRQTHRNLHILASIKPQSPNREGGQGIPRIGVGELIPVRVAAQVLTGLRFGVRRPKTGISLRKKLKSKLLASGNQWR